MQRAFIIHSWDGYPDEGWFPWLKTELEKNDEEKEIAKPWLETSIDFEKVKQHTKKFFAVFSNNDEVVPQENEKLFSERLGAKTAMERAKGHFSGSDGVKELPVILEAILSQ